MNIEATVRQAEFNVNGNDHSKAFNYLLAIIPHLPKNEVTAFEVRNDFVSGEIHMDNGLVTFQVIPSMLTSWMLVFIDADESVY